MRWNTLLFEFDVSVTRPSLAETHRISDPVWVHSYRTYAFTLLVAVGSMGCDAPPLRPLCPDRTLQLSVPRPLFNDKLDLLFVIDNTGTMEEEQRLLSAEMPQLFASLAGGTSPMGRLSFPHAISKWAW
jgi:hypothetical protein